jgi:pyridoxine 5-phosphate synthase
MTRLSVNLNKVALIRNSRGGNLPDLVQVAKDCERFGAHGITLHPRPDERHAKYSDIPQIKAAVQTEFNVEGNPNQRFLKLVMDNPPDQCTLVPDAPGVLTSSEGWDTIKYKDFLTDVIAELKSKDIRVSIFLDAEEKFVEGAKLVGADRIELYTGDFAQQFEVDPDKALAAHIRVAKLARDANLGLNAGHDLNLDNLKYYAQHVPGLLEVSIGHALISDALYYGLENTIQLYLAQLKA